MKRKKNGQLKPSYFFGAKKCKKLLSGVAKDSSIQWIQFVNFWQWTNHISLSGILSEIFSELSPIIRSGLVQVPLGSSTYWHLTNGACKYPSSINQQQQKHGVIRCPNGRAAATLGSYIKGYQPLDTTNMPGLFLGIDGVVCPCCPHRRDRRGIGSCICHRGKRAPEFPRRLVPM